MLKLDMARILIIDDDVSLTNLLKEHFIREGYEVLSAGYAAEGLQLAQQYAPDLIMLDLMLPDSTGFQACGKLRQNWKTHAIPIILMSSSARLPSQHAIAKLMGANATMVKPLNLIETGDFVHSLLERPIAFTKPRITPGQEEVA
jgi:DNA-binding response OmpR family regulator